MRSIRTAWLVTGEVRPAPNDSSNLNWRWDGRTIYFEHDGFPTEEEAKAALLVGWGSRSSYETRVTAIQKFTFKHSVITQDG